MSDTYWGDTMTATEPEIGEPRWHADPEGGPGLRWWDGTQWTAAVMGPAELGPPVQQPLPAETPVYTASLWAIVLLPLLTTAAFLSLPFRLFPTDFDPTAKPFVPPVDLSGLVRNVLSVAIYAASVALAFADRRVLERAGYVRPFHWAWAFLSPPVYIVGRSIIVQRRIGRGLTPIWVWLGVAVIGLVAVLSRTAELFTSVLR